MLKAIQFITVFMMAMLIAGCSSDDSGTNPPPEVTSASGSIGPTGGTVEIDGIISLTVPAGALSGTVDFTIDKNTSPAAPGGTMGYMSSAYTIGPSGTVFDIDAELEITYNPSASGLIHESTVVLCTYSGSSWDKLTTTVDQIDNTVAADVSHLSDFSAMADTSTVVDGVFAKLIVSRAIASIGDITRMDSYEAVFDSSYGICDPIDPIHNVVVTCNSQALDWDENTKMYIYPEVPDPNSPFITLGGTYTFTVTAGNNIPALNQAIVFPSGETVITTPAALATVTRSSGMQVEWNGAGSGTVEIMVLSNTEEVGYFIETNNDGSHFIEASNLIGINAGMGSVMLSHYNREAFSAAGYDSRSFKAARIIHTQMIILQ